MQTAHPSAYRSCTFSRVLVLAGILLLAGRPADAHDFWVDCDTGAWSPGERVTIYIAGGHRYSPSEFLLADRLIERFALRRPDGTWVDLERRADDKRWRAETALDQPGWYVAELIARRARATTPDLVARALFRLGETADPPPAIGTGQGLEIVPSWEDGDMMLATMRDGSPVSSRLVLFSRGGASLRSRTTSREPLRLDLDAGHWLIAAAAGSQSATLVLDLNHE